MTLLAIVLLVVGELWIVALAFSESRSWGLGCLLLPFLTLYFAVTRFENARIPFGIWVAGWILLLVGAKA